MLTSELPTWFWLLATVPVGLSLGSFLNVVIYRMPRGMSLAHPPSTCPACGQRISVFHNIPLFGWLLLRGKASCCKAPISPRYPLVEVLGGLTALAVVSSRVLPEQAAPVSEGLLTFALYVTLCLALLAAAAIDLEHMLLPDEITLGGTALGLMTSVFRPEVTLTSSALGAIGGFLGVWLPFIWAHQKLRGFAGMGLGDAKLLALAGAWFGPSGALFVLFAGATQGTLLAFVTMLLGKKLTEPKAVTEERQLLLAELAAADGEQRAELQRLVDADPVMREPDGSTLGARIAFGPFLALATIELVLFFEPISEFANQWLLFGW